MVLGESFEGVPESGFTDRLCCLVDESFLHEDLEEGHGDVVVKVVELLVLVRRFEVEDSVALDAVVRLVLVVG